MCFLPYPSIPPPFSHYSAWIPLERSFRYSYSYRALEQIRAAFWCDPLLVFPRLSRITQRGYRQRVHTITLTHSFFSLFFFVPFFLSIGVNQKCLLYFIYPLSIPRLSRITQRGYRWKGLLDTHTLFRALEQIEQLFMWSSFSILPPFSLLSVNTARGLILLLFFFFFFSLLFFFFIFFF